VNKPLVITIPNDHSTHATTNTTPTSTQDESNSVAPSNVIGPMTLEESLQARQAAVGNAVPQEAAADLSTEASQRQSPAESAGDVKTPTDDDDDSDDISPEVQPRASPTIALPFHFITERCNAGDWAVARLHRHQHSPFPHFDHHDLLRSAGALCLRSSTPGRVTVCSCHRM
jgi:hypothetical protein